jgi:hypothetical protein
MGRVDGSKRIQSHSEEERKMSIINWKEVKVKIEKILDEIFLEMPLEVKKLKAGILPHNAGHNRQYHSALESLMMTLMGWVFYSIGMVRMIMDDPSFTLEQCKKLIILGNRNPARYTGYIAYPTVWKLWMDVEASLQTVKNKEELKELMTPWLLFVNRMHFWNVEVYPWYLSKYVKTKAFAEIDGIKYFTGKPAVDSSPSQEDD